MGSLGKGTFAACFVALVAAAVWTAASYFTDWRLGILAPIVGLAAGAAMASGSERQGGVQGGLIAAIIALVAMVGSRYALTQLQLRDWAQRIASISDEDVVAALADRLYDEAALDGSLETMYVGTASDDEYPPQIWSRAESTWEGMTVGEREELRQAMIAENEEAMAEAAPILTGIGMLLNVGLAGMCCMGVSVVAAYRLGRAGLETATERGVVGVVSAGPARDVAKGVPAVGGEEVLGGPLRAAMKLPVDPLEGTEAGARSLTSAPPLRKAA
ncbi:MAG: hypothetical protein JNM94_04435 [Phycisphaerae bacterium]|nr:hypothetical protein [Phycisphaerae bacterium]